MYKYLKEKRNKLIGIMKEGTSIIIKIQTFRGKTLAIKYSNKNKTLYLEIMQ